MTPWTRPLVHGWIVAATSTYSPSKFFVSSVNHHCSRSGIFHSRQVSSMSASSSSASDALTAWVTDMYASFTSCTNSHQEKDVQAFYDKYALNNDVIFVRPSANPMTLQDYKDMATSKDITKHSGQVLMIHHVQELAQGKGAVVFFEGSQVFDYKGNKNDDNAMYSTTVEKQDDGTYKFAFMQRYPGKSNLE